MALTKIPRGLLDTGIADSSDATAITIDANENVTFGGTINVTGDGDDIIVSSADHELVLIGNRGSSGANLDKAYIRMKSESTNTVVIDTAGVSYFNGGNVGIGTTSPGTLLHLYNSSNAQMTFQNSTTGTTVGSDGYDITLQGSDIYHILRDSGNQRFYTAGTERMGIDSAGDVAVGSVTTLLRLQSVNSGTGSLPTDGTVGITAANANIPFGVHNESNSATYSGIAFETRTSGASRWLIANEWKSQYLGDLVFSRRTGGTSSAEAMRIDSSGNVSIGDSTADRLFHVKRSDSGGTVAKFENSAGTVYIELNTANQAGGDAGYLSYDSSKNLGLWTDDTQQVTIKSNGHVGINSDNPYTRFEVVGTSTAAYSATGFNAYSQIGLKQPDNNGGYTGIRFTNTGGNYEGFIGFTQTTASPSTKADFVVQGYNRDSTAYQEKFRITDGGEISTPQNPVFMCTGTGGWTAISGDNIINTSVFSVDYDRGGNFTASNGRFTAPVTGFYLFVFHTYTRANNTSGYVYPKFYVNGSGYADGSNTMIQHYQGHGDEDKGTCNTAHIYLTANQYVQVGHSAHGNSNPISYHGASLGFSGHLIG